MYDKTMRGEPVRFVSSASYLRIWLDNHPFKNDPEAPVWIDLEKTAYGPVPSAPFPETSKLSKINSIFSILALKLMGHERLSKISSYNHDTGFGFFAGLNVPPKTTATSTYSYM